MSVRTLLPRGPEAQAGVFDIEARGPYVASPNSGG
jgi:hypothetical protein